MSALHCCKISPIIAIAPNLTYSLDLAWYGPSSIKKEILQLDVIFAIPMVSGTTQLVSGLATDMQGDNGTVIYRNEYVAGMATHTRPWSCDKHNNYPNKGARINIEQYHTTSFSFPFETIFDRVFFSRENPCVDVGNVGGISSPFCSHPIVTSIFTDILRAGMFSTIVFDQLRLICVWWLNHISKKYGGSKKLSSCCDLESPFASCWYCCSFPPSRTSWYGPDLAQSRRQQLAIRCYICNPDGEWDDPDGVGSNYWHASDNGTVIYGHKYLAGKATRTRQ